MTTGPRSTVERIGPLRVPSAFRAALAVLAAAAAVALGARVDVPMVPVPMTLQSLAVVMAGGLLGSQRGALAMALYLGAGAAGLPIFAGGVGGPGALAGRTAGYLWSFPLAAAVSGLLPDRTGAGMRIGLFCGAHLLILGLGAAWLAGSLGPGPALEHGFSPFLVGAVVKSVVGATAVEAVRRRSAGAP